MTVAARITKRTCPHCARVFDAEAAFCPNDGAALEPPGDPVPDRDRYIGTVLHGDIEIRSVVGAGAMGRIYRAYQRGIDRNVAVKILHRELSGNTALVQRFHREAKIASLLQHPHVVEVYLAGQLPDGALYIAMEFLDGMSLASATQAVGGVMPLERALPIALQICDAVGEGHARGVVHRDLKPENVMLIRRADTSDWVKVLDFGIAKVSLGEQSMETAAGLIFGSARYISPEGAQGATVGPPGDVYSIAVILYELLAGRTPFQAEQPVGLLVKHIHDAPPPLRSWPRAADVPEPIARVVMENLAKDPSRRAESARALGNAIAAAARAANLSLSDVGVVARMSVHDLAASRSSSPDPEGACTSAGPEAPYDRAVDGGADRTSRAEPSNTSATGAPAAPSATRHSALLVLLAFLLGVAMTALVMQHFAYRPETEQTKLVQRARRALANGNYVDPPGDNVRDLVHEGSARWSDDSRFSQIQSDAAHELVTRAMAARSIGDVASARALVQTAYELDSTDETAKLLLEEYAAELRADGGAPRP